MAHSGKLNPPENRIGRIARVLFIAKWPYKITRDYGQCISPLIPAILKVSSYFKSHCDVNSLMDYITNEQVKIANATNPPQ